MEDSDTVTGMIARAIAALDGHYIAPPSPGSFGVGTGGVQVIIVSKKKYNLCTFFSTHQPSAAGGTA